MPDPPRPVASLVALAAAVAAPLLWTLPGSFQAASPALFLVGVGLFVALPGALACRLALPSPASPALVLAAGLPAGTALYALASRVLPPGVYAALLAALGVALLLRSARRREVRLPPAATSLAAGASALVLLWPLSQTSYRSVVALDDGAIGYLHAVPFEDTKIGGSDAFFHAAVTTSLVRSPGTPVNPFLVGAPLAYHFGMDRFASAFVRELGVSPLDLAARLLPSLFVLLLAALVLELCRSLGMSRSASALALALTMASDARLLLYLFPVQPEWTSRFWLGYFTAYPATTYYWVNPQLPALVLLVAGLLALVRFGDSLGGRLAGAALLASTALFKVFLALHVAIALPVVALLRLVRSKSTDWVPLVAATGALMLAIALGQGLYGGSTTSFRLAPLAPAVNSFYGAGLAPLAEVLSGFLASPRFGLALQALAAFGLYVVMVLGVRLVALPFTARALAQRAGEPVTQFLAVFFVVGLLPPLVVDVAASGMSNSFWFTNQSLFAGAFLVAAAADSWRSGSRRSLAVAAVLVVALVPTFRDVRFRGSQPLATVSPAEVEAARALRELSAPDAVVLHPVNRDAPSPASHLAGRDSVLTYWQGYPFSFAPAEAVERRAAEVAEIYETSDAARARDILDEYDAGWVFVPAGAALHFGTEGLLVEAYAKDGVRLYRSEEAIDVVVERDHARETEQGERRDRGEHDEAPRTPETRGDDARSHRQ